MRAVVRGNGFRPERWSFLFLLILSFVSADAEACRFLARLSGKPVARSLPAEEIDARARAVDAVIAELGGTGQAPSARRKEVLDVIEAELRAENRLFTQLSAGEKKELVESAILDVDQRARHAADRNEVQTRLDVVKEKVEGADLQKGAPWNLKTGQVRDVVLDALHQELADRKVRLAQLDPARQKETLDAVTREVMSRADAVKRALDEAAARNANAWKLPRDAMMEATLQILHRDLAVRNLKFETLGENERAALAAGAVAELGARLGPVEKALEAGINATGRPWNWQLMWQRNSMKVLVLDALQKELVKLNKSFQELHRWERKEIVEGLVASVLAPYRSRPTLLTGGIGLGVPIVLGYTGSIVLPEVTRTAWAVLTGVMAAPFTFGVNYWLAGKLKPIFSVGQTRAIPPPSTPLEKEVERIGSSGATPANQDNPFTRTMHSIGAASTGLPDPFKDGRNITKDSEINPRDSLNDAAWRIRDEGDARRTLAATVLYHSQAWPEIKINSILSFLLYMKLKERFGNPDAYRRIEDHIRDLARQNNVSPDEALNRLEQVLRPDLWDKGPSPHQPFSAEADRELRRLLARAVKPQEPEASARKVAWAALFYERHYGSTKLSEATTFEFYMRTKDWLAKPEAYDQAVKVIRDEAPGLGVSPDAAIRRLDAILRRDLWAPPG